MAVWNAMRLSASPAATRGLGSSRGTNVREAGPPPATKHDCTATSSSTPATGTVPRKPCTASSAEQTAWPLVMTMENRRRSTRSTRVPANSPNTMIGVACASPTAPVQTVLCVISQTWNMTATRVI